jgi:hypothetical protein
VVVDLLEVGIGGRRFGIYLVRCLEARLHRLLTERAEQGSAGDEAPQRRRVASVVPGLNIGVGIGGRRRHDRLVGFRQLVPFRGVDEEMERGRAFPPARIIIVLRDLVEAELFIVVGADPFGGVYRALLERRVDVAAGDLLRHPAELLDRLPGPSTDAELDAAEVGRRIDLLAEKAAHLGTGIAARQPVDVELPVAELVEQVHAAAVVEPGVLPARIGAERDRAIEREGRILADEIIGRGVAHLDRAVGHGVHVRQPGNDLAGGEVLDLELVVGRLGDESRQGLAGAVKGVERLGEAGGEPPLEFRRGLGDGGLGDGSGCCANSRGGKKLTAFHDRCLPRAFAHSGGRSSRALAATSSRGVFICRSSGDWSARPLPNY